VPNRFSGHLPTRSGAIRVAIVTAFELDGQPRYERAGNDAHRAVGAVARNYSVA